MAVDAPGSEIYMKIKRKANAKIIHLIKYALVGVFDTIILYIVYWVALMLGAHYLAGSLIGFFVSTASAYFLNTKYVFTREGEKPKYSIVTLFRTFIAYALTGIVLNNLFLSMWIEIFRVSQFIAPLLNTILNVPINYLLNKFWAFRARKSLREKIRMRMNRDQSSSL